MSAEARLGAAFFCASAALLAYEVLLTRVFAVVLFADLAHLALSLAMVGLAVGALLWHRWPGLVPADAGPAVARWTLAQAVTTVVALAALVSLPLVPPDVGGMATWFDRAEHRFALVNWGVYAALVPLLALPSTCAGVAFAGATGRNPDRAGFLYGCDLAGGALGAVLALLFLDLAQGADAACLCAAVATLGAAFTARGALRFAPVVGLVGAIAALPFDLFPVRSSVAWSEADLVETKWTPLARIALHRKGGEDTVLLDNTSASILITQEKSLAEALNNPGRSLVHRLFDPGARVAVLAAAAGPEIVVARHFGHTDVDAIDISGDVFDFAARAYPPGADNPYADPRTRRIALDARAAVRRADHPYDIIQLLNANLLSATGLLANAWSPSLLETREAFQTWFDHLSPDGVLSMAVNLNTAHALPVVEAVLAARGVTDPWACVQFEARANLLLVRPRPWTPDETTRLRAAASGYQGRAPLKLESGTRLAQWSRKSGHTEVMTDDHPFPDAPTAAWDSLSAGGTPAAMLYRTLLGQGALLLAFGAGVLGLPLLSRRRTGLVGLPGLLPALGLFACLGYGYLAVETGIVHAVVVYVGHPTYAVTTVVATMLLASGLGSLWIGGQSPQRVARRLPGLLLLGVLLGAVQAWITPQVLDRGLDALSLPGRSAAVAVSLAPLAFVLGTPFASALRLLGPSAPALVGWAWALNGWMSVLGGLVTVLLARGFGHGAATGVGLGAYTIAALLAWRITRERPDHSRIQGGVPLSRIRTVPAR